MYVCMYGCLSTTLLDRICACRSAVCSPLEYGDLVPSNPTLRGQATNQESEIPCCFQPSEPFVRVLPCTKPEDPEHSLPIYTLQALIRKLPTSNLERAIPDFHNSALKTLRRVINPNNIS